MTEKRPTPERVAEVAGPIALAFLAYEDRIKRLEDLILSVRTELTSVRMYSVALNEEARAILAAREKGADR